MSKISEREIQLYKGGNFADLVDFMDKKEVIEFPWVETQTVTPASAQFKLLPSSVIAGFIAKGTTSTTVNGGVVCAALAGAVGTAAITSIADTYGNILNLVEIRDSTSNDPIVDASNDIVYGLIQCSSAAADGAAIAANPSENVQISFVKFDSTNALALVTLNQALDFRVTKLYALRNQATLMKLAGSKDRDIVTGNQSQLERVLVVTTAFVVDEVITISTGAGGIAGVSTATGDTILLPASSALFVANGRVSVHRNGVRMSKTGTKIGVTWDSTNSFHCPFALDIGEEILIVAPSGY